MKQSPQNSIHDLRELMKHYHEKMAAGISRIVYYNLKTIKGSKMIEELKLSEGNMMHKYDTGIILLKNMGQYIDMHQRNHKTK